MIQNIFFKKKKKNFFLAFSKFNQNFTFENS